jgi:hypothetical protein
MTKRIEQQLSAIARIASTACGGAVLSIAASVGLLTSPVAQAHAPSSPQAAAALSSRAVDALPTAPPPLQGSPRVMPRCVYDHCGWNPPLASGLAAQPGHASEQQALPPPILVAPHACSGGCMKVGLRTPSTTARLAEQQPFAGCTTFPPVPRAKPYGAPSRPRPDCLPRQHAALDDATAGPAPLQLAGGDPTTVVDLWAWLRLRG